MPESTQRAKERESHEPVGSRPGICQACKIIEEFIGNKNRFSPLTFLETRLQLPRERKSFGGNDSSHK
jgi:hypothetical protein